ncbi:MAG: hypothetical protein JWN44_1707 [Myxococcales bacterium]|nr:hypothetical protein [Myxococcales bacterium]
MRFSSRIFCSFLLTACVGACSSSNGQGGDGGSAGSGGGGGGGAGGGSGGGGGGIGGGGDMALQPGTTMMRLVASNYTIPAGKEFYQCQHITVPNDLYIISITPVSPVGVHHEVVAIDPTPPADGVSTCQAIGTNWTPLFASGVGSPSLTMPDKVALKVAAGQHVVLNLHLFNATQQPLPTTGTSTAAVDVVVANDPTGYQLAGVPFVGNVSFTVPASGLVNGQCTMSNDTNYFAVFPHMHTTGQHLKVWTETAANGTTVVWDDDFLFNEQKFGQYPNWKGPQQVSLKKGDKIAVTCTYGAAGVGKKFGDSTTDEMCFGISYVYPAITTTFGTPFCVM